MPLYQPWRVFGTMGDTTHDVTEYLCVKAVVVGIGNGWAIRSKAWSDSSGLCQKEDAKVGTYGIAKVYSGDLLVSGTRVFALL